MINPKNFDSKFTLTYAYLDHKKNSHERFIIVNDSYEAQEKLSRLKQICKTYGYTFVWSIIELLDSKFQKE